MEMYKYDLCDVITCVLDTIVKSQSHDPVLRHSGSTALGVIQLLHDVPVGVDGLGTHSVMTTHHSADLEDPGPGAPDLRLAPGDSRAPGNIDSVKLRTRVWAHVVTVESKLLTPTNSYDYDTNSIYFSLHGAAN